MSLDQDVLNSKKASWGGATGPLLKSDWPPELPLTCHSSVLCTVIRLWVGAIPGLDTRGANEPNSYLPLCMKCLISRVIVVLIVLIVLLLKC